jgi:hypothetical protein
MTLLLAACAAAVGFRPATAAVVGGDEATVTRADLEAAKANDESGVTLTYFVEATGDSLRRTFGPATVTVRDERDAYDDPTAEFGGTDTAVVAPASSDTS